MFCSKCGMTVRSEDTLCPHCNNPIGDNRFDGFNPYTSVQFIIAPGQSEPAAVGNGEEVGAYARTNYTSMPDAEQQNAEPDSRTTYRPVYSENEVPEEVRKKMREDMNGDPFKGVRDAIDPEAAEAEKEAKKAEEERLRSIPDPKDLPAEAQELLEELSEELQPEEPVDLDQFRTRKIQSSGRAGISRDVSELMRQMDSENARKGGRHRRTAEVYDDLAEDQEPVQAAEGEEGERVEYADDEEYEYEGRPAFPIGTVIKFAIAAIAVAAIIFFGIKWIGHMRSASANASPIEGVSKSLYTDGIALLESHADGTYAASIANVYNTQGIAAMTVQLTADTAALQALMPEEPMTNDETFMSALTAVQNSIGNAITMDAMYANTEDASASVSRWQSVNAQIASLKAVTTATELTGVINNPGVAVVTATPEATQEARVYATLQKGDKSNEVIDLQNRLFNLGYLNDDRDGKFGSNTQTALKAFQEKCGLTATGIADSETQTRLYADDAPYATGHETPEPTAEPTPEPDMIQPAEVSGGDASAAASEDTDGDVSDV